MHTFPLRRWSQPPRATASWSGAVRGRRLAQGHLDPLGGAGDRTRDLQVTSQPALPPEPHAPQPAVAALSALRLADGLRFEVESEVESD